MQNPKIKAKKPQAKTTGRDSSRLVAEEMKPKLIYEAPQPTTAKEVLDAIRRDDVERLLKIPIELGFHYENWRFTQDISVQLSEHPDPSR